ncbi:MAG: hypothetical protein ACREYC_04580, partial [Gammaproteobacteria bacterium]
VQSERFKQAWPLLSGTYRTEVSAPENSGPRANASTEYISIRHHRLARLTHRSFSSTFPFEKKERLKFLFL